MPDYCYSTPTRNRLEGARKLGCRMVIGWVCSRVRPYRHIPIRPTQHTHTHKSKGEHTRQTRFHITQHSTRARNRLEGARKLGCRMVNAGPEDFLNKTEMHVLTVLSQLVKV